MKATLSSAYIQTLEQQLDVMAQLSLVSNMDALHGIWPKVQRVLDAGNVGLKNIGNLPSCDDELNGFRESVTAAFRPRLSKAMMILFRDPTPYTKAILGKVSLQRAQEIHAASMLDEISGNMFVASSVLYHQLGKQLDVAVEYFTLKATASDELMWRMMMLFVVHDQSTNVLKLPPATEPHNAHAFSVSVKNMIAPHLESTLSRLLNGGIGRDVLVSEHAITMERVDRAVPLSLITPSTRKKAARVLRPVFSRLFGGR